MSESQDLASVRADWPASAEKLAALLGDADTLELLAVAGGMSFYVPSSYKGRSAKSVETLTAQLGSAHLVRRLMHFFAGEQLSIPRCHAARLVLRDVAIHKDYAALLAEGATSKAARDVLIHRYGLVNRMMLDILNRPAPILREGQPE